MCVFPSAVQYMRMVHCHRHGRRRDSPLLPTLGEKKIEDGNGTECATLDGCCRWRTVYGVNIYAMPRRWDSDLLDAAEAKRPSPRV